MATVETIQASGGDYTTPQAWYNDHAGDITSDANAPYIGEMAAETFASSSDLDMQTSTTDATHYFHLRAQSGYEFDGDFDGSHPVIASAVSPRIYAGDDYFRCEHIVVDGTGTASANTTGIEVRGDNCLLDGVGVRDIVGNSSSGSMNVYGIYSYGENNTIRNCAVGNTWAQTTKSSGNAYAYAIYARNVSSGNVYLYNNAVEYVYSRNTASSARSYSHGIVGAIYTAGTAYCINNVVGTQNANGGTALAISTTSGKDDRKYNATTDTSGGTNSQDSITPADDFEDTTLATLDLHMKTGGDCEDNGYDLLDNGYTNAPEYDCDDDARPDGGTWSIGIDHHASTSTTTTPSPVSATWSVNTADLTTSIDASPVSATWSVGDPITAILLPDDEEPGTPALILTWGIYPPVQKTWAEVGIIAVDLSTNQPQTAIFTFPQKVIALEFVINTADLTTSIDASPVSATWSVGTADLTTSIDASPVSATWSVGTADLTTSIDASPISATWSVGTADLTTSIDASPISATWSVGAADFQRFPAVIPQFYHAENTRPLYHAENTRPLYHAENTRPLYHAENTRPLYHATKD